MQNKTVKSVYIHIPFCKNICNYCDFCKNFYNSKIVLNYLNSLKKEVKENYKGELLKTIYIGGGTPSALSFVELDKLFEITNSFNLEEDYEFTFECNYEDITSEFLEKLKKNKVNRLSIGIQTFNKKFEETLGRKIDKKGMISKVLLAKKYFSNINIDLMYALSLETTYDLKQDLNEFLNLEVTHISTYALIIEKHTKLGIKNYSETDDDMQAKMYELIKNTLKKNGYNHYEISNFAKTGFESKHNLTYWNNNWYYGFGAGASGFINNIRYDNTKSVLNYINEKYNVFYEKQDKTKLINDEIMLGLRKIDGINKVQFKEKYGLDIKEIFNLKEIIKLGYLKENNKNIYIPEKYLFVSNEIILKVLQSSILNKD